MLSAVFQHQSDIAAKYSAGFYFMNALQKCIILKTKTFGFTTKWIFSTRSSDSAYTLQYLANMPYGEANCKVRKRLRAVLRRNYSFNTLSCLLYVYACWIKEYIHRSHIDEFPLSDAETSARINRQWAEFSKTVHLQTTKHGEIKRDLQPEHV